MANVILLFWSA